MSAARVGIVAIQAETAARVPRCAPKAPGDGATHVSHHYLSVHVGPFLRPILPKPTRTVSQLKSAGVLWGVSQELGANPKKFNSALIRFYLHEATGSQSMARRLKRLSTSDLAAKSPKTKLTLRSDSKLLERVKRVEEREGVSRSELVRGAVIAVKQDVFDRPAKARLAQLRAIAEAI